MRAISSNQYLRAAPQRPVARSLVKAEAEKTGRTYRTIFGTQEPHQVSLEELIGNDGGEPRFVAPYYPSLKEENRTSLPILIYAPGIDGTGLGAYRQLECLAKGFQLESFMIPLNDKHSFQDLASIFTSYVRDVVGPEANHRMVYLMGESFGALLALAAAYECRDIVDRVILANPATSYSSSFWSNLAPVLPAIPKPMYPVVAGLMAPLVVNPLGLLLKNLDRSTPIAQRPNQIIEGGQQMLGTLSFISDNVDADMIKWKLDVVKQGIEHLEPFLHKIPQRTLVIASENDLLLPSTSEAERLKDVMLRAFVATLPGKSHAFMEESGVDLLQLLKDEGFYIMERNLTSTPKSNNGSLPPKNGFGKAAPIEVPSKEELKRLDYVVENMRTSSSPVFLSTLNDGSVVEGLEGVPQARPLLIVGNHTLMALDMNFLVYQLVKDRDILVRGLAHPAVMSDAINIVKKPENSNIDLGPAGEILIRLFNPRNMHKLYTTFGGVPNSARNMHRLLSLGERVLLYPGGAVEGLKLRDQKYELMWPQRSEFVRMAAKFGATVVTVASVGSEDGVHQLLDIKDMKNSPLFGDAVQKIMDLLPRARSGAAANESKMMEEALAPPIFFPIKPARQYFMFGKPVRLTPDLAQDKEKSAAFYNHFKVELETNISYLIEKREEDPYKDFEKRIVFERLNQKQAPSFTLNNN